jgi:hypothetical protein
VLAEKFGDFSVFGVELPNDPGKLARDIKIKELTYLATSAALSPDAEMMMV